MSAPGKANKRDFWSGIRHTVVPAVAGGALVLVEAINPALLNLSPMEQALATAAIAGISRFLQRFLTKVPDVPIVTGKTQN